MHQRRRAPRTPTQLQAEFTVLDAGERQLSQAAMVRDLCDGGLCLRTDRSISPGRMMELAISTPSSDEPVRAIGRTVHWRHASDGFEVGLELLWMNGSLDAEPQEAQMLWSFL